MSDAKTCRWCDAEAMFGPIRLYAPTNPSTEVMAATTPTTGVMRKVTTVPIATWVCRQCGHLALFATEPEVLFERWSAGDR